MARAGWRAGCTRASRRSSSTRSCSRWSRRSLIRSSSTTTRSRSRRWRRSGRAGTSSARCTPSRASRPRSTSRCSAIGATTRRGRKPASRRRPARPTGSGRSFSPRTSRRRSIRPGARRSTRSSSGASPRVASRPTIEPDHTNEGSVKQHTQVVVIGGGVVGASVLYHLTKAGWTDVVLLERRELTAGSTWHAAGGMHTLNGDPHVARLQQYTIQLYAQIERESGQDCSIHLPGGLMLASDETRMDFLRMAVARGRYLGMQLEMISAKEAAELFPLLDPQYFVGALYDHVEGHVDPTGVTRAYVKCAQLRGAEVRQRTPVTALRQRPDGTWDVHLENGAPIHAEHVVNAGGLWAREVGRFAGIELPVLAMEHHYLLTEPMDEVIAFNREHGRELPHMIDFGGEIYARQEGQSILLGTYEQNNRPWAPKETPWDFVFQLLPHDLDRIAPELEKAFEHFPLVGKAGIQKFVNGPFTFSPDGNPLVGPIKGLRGMWSACAVMAGLSQGGGVGLSLANWMVEGDPGADIWGMDVARYGPWASLAYTNAKVRENYSRRFRITFPNEELPAARPLHTTPIYDRLSSHNAVWGAGFGLEHPLWFQEAGKEPIENVTFHRSNAFELVAEESRAVRERVGLSEASNFAKYKVSGDGAAEWLQSLFTNSLPKIGRTNLTAMLNPQGRIIGEFSVSRLGPDEFFLFGSQAAEVHHPRWFLDHLPQGSAIRFDV